MKKFMAVLAMVAVVAFAAPALAATNPFMDVPQGHWSYDAVGLLASRGIVSGYPDGAFKGAQPATRYEMASVVARALVTVDAEKASKQDLELLKKLVMEFKDELDALGVKVDSLDKRVAVLEDGIGGWKVRGTFWFDANFAGGDQATSSSMRNFVLVKMKDMVVVWAIWIGLVFVICMLIPSFRGRSVSAPDVSWLTSRLIMAFMSTMTPSSVTTV